MDVNKIIREYLKSKGVSQFELAKLTGISQPNIHRLLNANDIKISQLSKITKALKLPITYFFDGKEHVANEEIDGYNKRIAELEEMLGDKRRIIIERERQEVEQVKKLLNDILGDEFKELSEQDKKEAYEIVVTEAKNSTNGKSWLYDLNKRSEIIELINNDLIAPKLHPTKDLTVKSGKDSKKTNKSTDRKLRKFKDK